MNNYRDSEWIGKKFGKLTVVEPVHITNSNGGHQWFWRVRCDCGNERVINPRAAIIGRNVSCGCYRMHEKKCPTKTHGESHTRLHNIWCGINSRCDSAHKNTERYGRRGIGVCEEWRDYTVFAEWARNNGYDDGLSIERIDVNGNYSPENCTWIPMKRQARNRSTTHWVEYDGERMSLAEACERAGMPYKQVFERIVKRHWSIEEALNIPIGAASQRQTSARSNP